MSAQPYDLSGQKILVTGSSRGIGRAIAICSARAGADVVVNYRKNADAAQEVVRKIESLGGKATAIGADVSNPDEVRSLFVQSKEFLGGLSAVAVNAGIASKAVTVRDTPDEEIERVFATDLLGAYYCAREAAKILHEQKQGGTIVMISSVLAETRGAKMGPYAVAKTALEGLKTMLAREEAKARIRVNNILPGLVNTDMGAKVTKPMGVDDPAKLGPAFPFGRVCEPEDIGNVFVFLASTAGSYVTGQSIMVEGGTTLIPGMF